MGSIAIKTFGMDRDVDIYVLWRWGAVVGVTSLHYADIFHISSLFLDPLSVEFES